MERISLNDILLPGEKYWRLTEQLEDKKRKTRIVALGIGGFRIFDPQSLGLLYKVPLVHIKTFSYGVDSLHFEYTKTTGEQIRVVLKPKRKNLHHITNTHVKMPIVSWLETQIQLQLAEQNSVSTPRSVRLNECEDSVSESLPNSSKRRYSKGYKQL